MTKKTKTKKLQSSSLKKSAQGKNSMAKKKKIGGALICLESSIDCLERVTLALGYNALNLDSLKATQTAPTPVLLINPLLSNLLERTQLIQETLRELEATLTKSYQG